MILKSIFDSERRNYKSDQWTNLKTCLLHSSDTALKRRLRLPPVIGNKWATIRWAHMSFVGWQNQQKDMCAQRRLRSAWASAQSDQSHSLCAQWAAKDPSFLDADSECSNQTGRMPRLICEFSGRTCILLVLSWGGSNNPPIVQTQGTRIIPWPLQIPQYEPMTNKAIDLHMSHMIPTDDLIPKTRRCRNQHSMTFQTPIANTDVYRGSFFPRTIRDWNALPDSLISYAEDAEDCVAKFTSLVRARD